MITSFIIRYRDAGATPGEYKTVASEQVGDSRKRLAVRLVNASRLIGTDGDTRSYQKDTNLNPHLPLRTDLSRADTF